MTFFLSLSLGGGGGSGAHVLYRSGCPGTPRLEAEQVAEVEPRVKRDLRPPEGAGLSQGHTAQARWTEHRQCPAVLTLPHPGERRDCKSRCEASVGLVSFIWFISEDHDQPQGVRGHRSDQQAASACALHLRSLCGHHFTAVLQQKPSSCPFCN